MTPPSRPLPRCRVCEGADVTFLCKTFNEHSATQWLDNYRCRTCGSVFIGNPLPDAEFAQAYATQDQAAYYAETAAASAAKFAQSVKELLPIVGRHAKLLDIGGGNGAFIRELARAGYDQLYIHEIGAGELPDVGAMIKGHYVGTDYSRIPSGAFDAVTMMDVLEHVPSPRATLKTAHRVLKPGGCLYLHTPVVTTLDRVMHGVLRLPGLGRVGRAWQRARTSIFHLQNYTPRALSALLAQAGFRIERVECRNELSWPVERYIRVYLVEKQGLPAWAGWPLAALLKPVVASPINANKAVVLARRDGEAAAKT